jgi:hypothetical protein
LHRSSDRRVEFGATVAHKSPLLPDFAEATRACTRLLIAFMSSDRTLEFNRATEAVIAGSGLEPPRLDRDERSAQTRRDFGGFTPPPGYVTHRLGSCESLAPFEATLES